MSPPTPLAESIAVRDAIARGEIPGPTLYVSGPFIQHAPYPGTEAFRWGVSGPEDARVKVRRLAEAGVDVVKLIDDAAPKPGPRGPYKKRTEDPQQPRKEGEKKW